MAGDAGTTRASLEEEAERLGIEDRIHFATEGSTRPGLFALFDIVALPDVAEGAPPFAREAMAAGCPVIANRHGELPAMLASDNGPFLAEPGDDEDLAAQLRSLARAPANRKRVGQANRAKAREEFDQSRMIERTRALYFGLMGLPKGGAIS